MSRNKLILPKDVLEKAINDAEASNTFDNRSALYTFVCDKLKTCLDDKGNIKTLTPSVIYLRVNEYGLVPKTPIGAKGNISLISRPKKEESFRKRPDFSISKEAMEKHFVEKPKLVKKVLNGSAAAAIKLNCYECSGFDQKEAGRCTLIACTFYHFNPFIEHSQRNSEGKLKKEEGGNEEEIVDILDQIEVDDI